MLFSLIIPKAVETLKSFENKDTRTACTAATNLSFLYFLEGDFAQADRYADQALAADRYSPAGSVSIACSSFLTYYKILNQLRMLLTYPIY